MAPQAPRAPNLNLKSQSQISDPISRAPNLNLKSQSQISDLRPQSPCRSNPPSPSRSFEALISIHTANLQISALKSLGWRPSKSSVSNLGSRANSTADSFWCGKSHSPSLWSLISKSPTGGRVTEVSNLKSLVSNLWVAL